MTTIGILDYGSGNILSVMRAIEKVGSRAKLIAKNEDFKDLSHLIIPGVGAFPSAMEKLKSRDLHLGILKHVERGKKLLGICVGMQMLFENSHEHEVTNGLGLLQGKVLKINTDPDFQTEAKIPNIGWREVSVVDFSSPFKDLSGEKFYHVHSYAPHFCSSKEIVGNSEYAGIELNVLVGTENIFGAQFHPEKSGKAGLSFLETFCR